MGTSIYSFRIDIDLKAQAEAIYGAMGQTLDSAINAFLIQSVRVGGFPFEMRLPKSERENILAMLETNEIMEHSENHDFMDVEDALEKLKR